VKPLAAGDMLLGEPLPSWPVILSPTR